MESIGLLGGTFDPVHKGHLELAKGAKEKCSLSEIIFIPSSVPPHKSESITPFNHRVEMLKLAICEEKSYSISTIEETLSSPNYTIDTLYQLITRKGLTNDYYFIIGIDAFLELSTWKEPDRVLQIVDFIVSARQGYTKELFSNFMVTLNYRRSGSFWNNKKSNRRVYYLDVRLPGISSSTLRKKIRENCPPREFIQFEVLQYIKKYNLYSN